MRVTMAVLLMLAIAGVLVVGLLFRASRPVAAPLPAVVDAARAGDAAAVRLLTDLGADLNERGGRNNWTPLMHAVHGGHAEAARLLLEGGADPDARTADGWTALMMAASYGDAAMAELLLDHGANAFLLRGHGLTALDMALIGSYDTDRFTLFQCQEDAVELLLDRAPGITFYGDFAEINFVRVKGCGAIIGGLAERRVPRMRPRLRREIP